MNVGAAAAQSRADRYRRAAQYIVKAADLLERSTTEDGLTDTYAADAGARLGLALDLLGVATAAPDPTTDPAVTKYDRDGSLNKSFIAVHAGDDEHTLTRIKSQTVRTIDGTPDTIITFMHSTDDLGYWFDTTPRHALNVAAAMKTCADTAMFWEDSICRTEPGGRP